MYISCVWLEFYCIAVNDSPSSHRYLGVVDREWALWMRHQISLPPTIWVIDNLCTPGLAACQPTSCQTSCQPPSESRDQYFPRLHSITRGAHTLGTSMLCLWGCISLPLYMILVCAKCYVIHIFLDRIKSNKISPAKLLDGPFNPLMLAATKTVENLGKIFLPKSIFWENIWRRNVHQIIHTSLSLSNIL